jgi:hypothetical protein
MTIPSSVLNIDPNGYSNLLTANQSTGTDTLGNTTGFNSTAGATLSSSTEQASEGSRSLKVVTPGVALYEGTRWTSITGVASTPYTLTCKVLAPLGAKYRVNLTDMVDNNNQTSYTGTGEWQDCSVSFTTDAHTTVAGYIVTDTSIQAITFYVDKMQLESGSVAHNWITGGTNSSSSEGTIEMEIYWGAAVQANVFHPFFGIQTASARNTFQAEKHSDGRIYIESYDTAGNTSNVNVLESITHDSLVRIAFKWSSSILKLYIDGNSVGTPATNPKLPTVLGSALYLGSGPTGASQCDVPIRKLHINRRALSDTEIASRAATVANGGSYTVTKDTTFYIDGQYDIRGYKIAAGG